MNKRGAEMSTNTIILLILGVIILVVLVLGFSIGWEKINPFVSKQNVDDVKSGCGLACGAQQVYNFCSQPRTLIDSNKNEFRQISCYALSTLSETGSYEIADCSIDCTPLDFDGVVPLVKGISSCVGHEGKSILELSGKVRTFKQC